MARDITEQWEAERRLRASQALLAHAEKIANFGSWEYDVAARRLLLSEHLRYMYSLAPDEEWTDEMQWERVHPGDRERVREISIRATALGEPFSHVSRYLPPDGGVRVHFTRGVPVIGPEGKVLRWIGVIQDITGQARAEEELRRLTQELMRARDDDRRHMARELHASAGQSLAALKMSLGRLGSELPRGRDLAHELLNSAIELAEGAIREVRTVSYLMHPPMLDEAGLASALRWYADGFAKRSGIQVSVKVSEDFGRHSQEIETTVFRIVQEALTNVHRYSGSRTATIRLGSKDGQIRAEVRDEGCGLPPAGQVAGARAPLGVGIASIRERVKQLNGAFEIQSAPGLGTTVRVTLPTAAERPQGIAAVHEMPPARTKLKTRARRRVKHASRR
jgi:PAS domain S-box-containing protein